MHITVNVSLFLDDQGQAHACSGWPIALSKAGRHFSRFYRNILGKKRYACSGFPSLFQTLEDFIHIIIMWNVCQEQKILLDLLHSDCSIYAGK